MSVHFRYMEGKVFVALGNGDLVVYCRDIGKFLLYVGIKSVISVIKKESFPGRSRVRILVRAFTCMLVSLGYFLCIYVFICVYYWFLLFRRFLDRAFDDSSWNRQYSCQQHASLGWQALVRHALLNQDHKPAYIAG